MHDYGGWMWLLMDVVLVVILAGALTYAIGTWRRRSRAADEVGERATNRLYCKQQ